MRIAILLGFNRCGSSMVASILSRSADVNLILQPFNSSGIGRSQWEIWDEAADAADAERFIQGIECGTIDRCYTKSEWIFREGSTAALSEMKMNVIKDTNIQFKTRWFRSRFPNIQIVGLWRDPLEIVESLVRNDFIDLWYGSLTKECLLDCVDASPDLEEYGPMLSQAQSQLEIVAIGIAMRLRYHVANSSAADWFRYEEFVDRPSEAFEALGRRLGVEVSVKSEMLRTDFNIAGRPFTGRRKIGDTLSPELVRMLEERFEGVRILFNEKWRGQARGPLCDGDKRR